ncbi:MAG TPA: DUF5602 domain-containing protein [Flavisolibacter sp.]|nr:DUF5602 domain-containing protein [Flavisolibacter sp.]
MRHRSTLLVIWATAAIALISSCKKEVSNSLKGEIISEGKASQEQKANTFYGPENSFGGGKVRSFFTVTHDGVPVELGVQISSAAFGGLTTEPGEYSYLVALHQKARALTPFDHIEVDWNPFGHPPPGIYDTAHFDFHFYKITEEAQMAIPPYTEQTASMFDAPPPPGYLPAGYIPGPGGVPQMGKHWLDVTSPEFHGQPFTKTFIYGTYNGAVTFYEPMVTRAYIESGVSSSTTIRQPQYFSPTNTYYPTKYNVYTDAKTGDHYISLTEFVWR